MSMPAQALAAMKARELIDKRAAARAALDELPTLDFGNLQQVLTWLSKVASAADHQVVSLEFPWSRVVEAFQGHGFEPSAQLTPSVFEAGAEESARAIISFALNGMMGYDLVYRAVPRDVLPYVRRWRDVFGS